MELFLLLPRPIVGLSLNINNAHWVWGGVPHCVTDTYVIDIE